MFALTARVALCESRSVLGCRTDDGWGPSLGPKRSRWRFGGTNHRGTEDTEEGHRGLGGAAPRAPLNQRHNLYTPAASPTPSESRQPPSFTTESSVFIALCPLCLCGSFARLCRLGAATMHTIWDPWTAEARGWRPVAPHRSRWWTAAAAKAAWRSRAAVSRASKVSQRAISASTLATMRCCSARGGMVTVCLSST